MVVDTTTPDATRTLGNHAVNPQSNALGADDHKVANVGGQFVMYPSTLRMSGVLDVDDNAAQFLSHYYPR